MPLVQYAVPAYLGLSLVERWFTKPIGDTLNGVKYSQDMFESMSKEDVEILKINLDDIVKTLNDNINYNIEKIDPITHTVYEKNWTAQELERQILKLEYVINSTLQENARLEEDLAKVAIELRKTYNDISVNNAKTGYKEMCEKLILKEKLIIKDKRLSNELY